MTWQPDRRRFLGLAVTGAATGVAATALGACGASGPEPPRAVPFRGAHQAGVTRSAPPSGAALGLDVDVGEREELVDLLRDLSETVEGLMADRPPAERDGGFPPSDTGIVGPDHPPTGTAVVLGLGASLFDDRFGLTGRRPPGLVPMPRFANDHLVADGRSHGDLSLVVSARSHEAVAHALRQVLRRTRGRVRPRWMQAGTNQPEPEPDEVRGTFTGRNLMGFKDGTVNPDPRHAAVMDDVVWVGAADDHPAWAVGGTYQAIRLIRMQVEFWDRTRLSEQEAIFHRRRDSGAPLGREHELDEPVFETEEALRSHIGRIHPRGPGQPRFRMLRRGFNYANGLDGNDQLDQGLVFVAYQRDLETGFVGTQRLLDGEALEEYVRPLGGGLFFAPPAPARGEFLGERLVT